jgi:hypothetical protein
LIGSIIAKALAILRSIADRPVDPISPGSIPIFRNPALVGRVIYEFREFEFAALLANEGYRRFPNVLVRPPTFWEL